MRALHVLSVVLNIFVPALISCGTDHQLKSVMIINAVHQAHKNIIDVCTELVKVVKTIRNGLAQPAI